MSTLENAAFRVGKWFALGLVVVLAAVGSSQETPTPAFAAGLTAEFSIAVNSPNPPMKGGCDSEFGPDFKCIVHPGGTFKLFVFLDKLAPGLPDGGDPDALGGYNAIGVRLDHSPGLTFVAGSQSWGWPDCDADFDDSLDVGLVNLACVNEGVNGSTFASGAAPVVTLDFTCPAVKSVETITLVFGTEGDKIDAFVLPYDTVLADETGANVTQSGPSETLVINCDNVFPWDLNGDNAVSSLDIFDVLGHFGQTKPTP
jgi:hypothetical protein